MPIDPDLAAALDAYQCGVAAVMAGDLPAALACLHTALARLAPTAHPRLFAAVAHELADVTAGLAARDPALIPAALRWSRIALHPEDYRRRLVITSAPAYTHYVCSCAAPKEDRS